MCNIEDTRDVGSIPQWGRCSIPRWGRCSIPRWGKFPAVGNGNPLQYSCLENPMVRGVWQATVHRVTKESKATEYGTVLYILNESIPFLIYPSEVTKDINTKVYILIIHILSHMRTEKFLSFLRSYHPTRTTLPTSFQSVHVESLVPLNGCTTRITRIYHTLCMLSFTDRDLMVSRALVIKK